MGRWHTAGAAGLIVGCLYAFPVSVALVGRALAMAGGSVSQALPETTDHPLLGLLIGVLATSLWQSSSAITSLLVGMVGSGQLTLAAVPLVMGATIGTTITSTLIALTQLSRSEESAARLPRPPCMIFSTS